MSLLRKCKGKLSDKAEQKGSRGNPKWLSNAFMSIRKTKLILLLSFSGGNNLFATFFLWETPDPLQTVLVVLARRAQIARFSRKHVDEAELLASACGCMARGSQFWQGDPRNRGTTRTDSLAASNAWQRFPIRQ